MNRLNERVMRKRLNNMALKSSIKKDEENDEDLVESKENENLNLLTKKFGMYLKRKGNKGN